MAESFKWFSPLGTSVALFMAIGALWVVIGALTVPFHNRSPQTEMGFVSPVPDQAYFGKSASELSSDPAFTKFRTLTLTVIAGFLLLAGVLFLCIAWFGLRQRHTWALYSLSGAGLLATGFWAFSLLPYVRSGIHLTIGDLPPFMWMPATLILPATVLGWIGLRS